MNTTWSCLTVSLCLAGITRCTREPMTHMNLGTLTEIGLSAVTLQYKKLASRGSSSVDCRNPDYTGRPSTDFDR